MESFPFSALPIATGHLFQGNFASWQLENEVRHILSLQVLMVLLCLQLNWIEQQGRVKLEKVSRCDVGVGKCQFFLHPFHSCKGQSQMHGYRCTRKLYYNWYEILCSQVNIITFMLYYIQIPTYDWIHERENYLSKDVVITKASRGISWQVVAHKFRC